jgi:ABC-type xylose transport system substrate-binding protein
VRPRLSERGADEITVALSLSTLDNPLFAALRDGVEEAVAERGVRVIVVDAGNDAAVQTNQVQVLTARRVRAVIINPVDSRKALPAAKAAETAGIPLVSVDRAVEGGKIASEVASDNVQGGTLAAIELGRATNGNVVHLKGVPGASATQDRGLGFEHGLNSGSIKVVAAQTAGFSRARAQDVVAGLAQSKLGSPAFSQTTTRWRSVRSKRSATARAGTSTWSASTALPRRCGPSRTARWWRPSRNNPNCSAARPSSRRSGRRGERSSGRWSTSR